MDRKIRFNDTDYSDLYEDEGCFECGELNYSPSKTVGICFDCANEFYSSSSSSSHTE